MEGIRANRTAENCGRRPPLRPPPATSPPTHPPREIDLVGGVPRAVPRGPGRSPAGARGPECGRPQDGRLITDSTLRGSHPVLDCCTVPSLANPSPPHGGILRWRPPLFCPLIPWDRLTPQG
eukprot:748651-Prorocentrum_minimum.AAC.1